MFFRWKNVLEKIRNNIYPLSAILALLAGIVFSILSLLLPSELTNKAQNAYPLLTFVILMGIVAYVIRIKTKLEERRETEIYVDETQALRYIQEFISSEKPKRADLLEYAGMWASSTLASLKASGCKIRLLVQHPDFVDNKFQKQRIRHSINALAVTFKSYKDVEIRAYRVHGSLRARKFGDALMCVGWFTYTYQRQGVTGHDNPIIIAPISGDTGKSLKVMFDRVFEELWNRAKEDGDVVFTSGQLNSNFLTEDTV